MSLNIFIKPATNGWAIEYFDYSASAAMNITIAATPRALAAAVRRIAEDYEQERAKAKVEGWAKP